MVEFGKFVLKYKAPNGAAEPDWKRKISAEATLPEMLAFFEKFLQDAGYELETGSLEVKKNKIPETPKECWGKYFETTKKDESRDNP
jgi:hypothetical protein